MRSKCGVSAPGSSEDATHANDARRNLDEGGERGERELEVAEHRKERRLERLGK
jgi:hypothetical protein